MLSCSFRIPICTLSPRFLTLSSFLKAHRADHYPSLHLNRYDAVPDDLVLNNTIQIVYNSSAPPATPYIVYDIETFDDTKVVPLEQEDFLRNPDVEIDLHAYFDVRASYLFTPASFITCQTWF